jgi:hypothetical protein
LSSIIIVSLFLGLVVVIISSQSIFGQAPQFFRLNDTFQGNPYSSPLSTINNNLQQKNTNITTNQTTGLKSYTNGNYNFKIDFPSAWKEENPSNIFSLIGNNEIFKIGAPTNDLNPMRTGANTVFSITVENTSRSLNPSTMKVESATAEDYGKKEVSILSSPMDMGGLQATFDITKNNAMTLNDNQAWRVDHITNLSGTQSSYESKVFLVNEGKLYTLSSFTDPLKAPDTLPEFEKILNSFTFT